MGKKRIYSESEKIKYFTKRLKSNKTTPQQKTYAAQRLSQLKGNSRNQNNQRTARQSQRQVQPTQNNRRVIPPARTADGRVPQGRTLKTYDKYLDAKAKEPEKERPVVVIEANEDNDLAVVQLSTKKGSNRTHLPDYQQGQSYYKHFVEIMDDEGNPIRVNDKFQENHPNMDVSQDDVSKIRDTVFNHSVPCSENQKKMEQFRNKKKTDGI